MISTNYFNNDGSLSSVKTSTGVGTISRYIGSSRGGSTFTVGNISTRISNSGRYMGSAYSMFGRTSYFNSSGGLSSHRASF